MHFPNIKITQKLKDNKTKFIKTGIFSPTHDDNVRASGLPATSSEILDRLPFTDDELNVKTTGYRRGEQSLLRKYLGLAQGGE